MESGSENGTNGAEPDFVSTVQLAELNRQVERGSLFTQATLQRGFERIGETEKLIGALTMALIAKGVVSAEELGVSVEPDDDDDFADADEYVVSEAPRDPASGPGMDDAAGAGEGRKDKIGWPSIAIRVDPTGRDAEPSRVVDCAARMHVCQAVCCRLKFPLSGPEIDRGHVKWDIGHPYIIRQGSDGRCVHNDATTGHCGVYEDRPGVCRRYTCIGDARIWKDFDNMVLNQEWIDEHIGGNDLHVSAVLPSMQEPEVWDPGMSDVS